ncbi:MAG: DUF167 domain-containing protein [Fimbriimonadaceae bacterium]|nr:DUF167 domain-containing protein [Fimbriimonadaceae bacterium]
MPDEVFCEFDVKVIPRSSRNKVESPDGVTLKVWVTAAPTDGQANEAVIDVLAKQLKISKSSVTLVRGHTARNKRVRLQGLSHAEAIAKL